MHLFYVLVAVQVFALQPDRYDALCAAAARNGGKIFFDKPLRFLYRDVARHGYDVYYNGEKIGIITSGGISPVRGDNIALAYIENSPEYKVDSKIGVMIRDKICMAQIIKKPFVTKRNKTEV